MFCTTQQHRAPHELSLVMRLGQRFESARRLSILFQFAGKTGQEEREVVPGHYPFDTTRVRNPSVGGEAGTSQVYSKRLRCGPVLPSSKGARRHTIDYFVSFRLPRQPGSCEYVYILGRDNATIAAPSRRSSTPRFGRDRIGRTRGDPASCSRPLATLGRLR